MYQIGSQALQEYGFRQPKDNDYICMEEDYLKYKETYASKIVYEQDKRFGKTLFIQGFAPNEFEIGKDGNLTEQLIKIIEENSLHDYMNVHPEVVYTMKMSHRYLRNSPHFKKAMDDIHWLRSRGFGNIPDCLKDWYKARMKATYDYGHPSLKQSKDAFFADDGVGYIYDHDTIHETVAIFERPAFEMIKEDKAEVFCSKDKFFNSDEKLKLATVVEETYVLALERSQIPNYFRPKPLDSFKKSLEKVCTSISSGWWREYAWENYEKVFSMYDPNYVIRFQVGLEAGIVKPYKR